MTRNDWDCVRDMKREQLVKVTCKRLIGGDGAWTLMECQSLRTINSD